MKFNIEIKFEDWGVDEIISNPELTYSQIESLKSIPPYYYNLSLSGYIDENKFIIESASTNNHGKILPITHRELDELMYESNQLDLIWIINNIK